MFHLLCKRLHVSYILEGSVVAKMDCSLAEQSKILAQQYCKLKFWNSTITFSQIMLALPLNKT